MLKAAGEKPMRVRASARDGSAPVNCLSAERIDGDGPSLIARLADCPLGLRRHVLRLLIAAAFFTSANVPHSTPP